LNPLAGNNDAWTHIITSPAETAGLWPDLKRHAHFSAHSSSYKSKGFSIHLFVTHSDAETTEDTPIIFHGKSNFEKPHAGGNVLSDLDIGSARDQEFGKHFSRADDSWGSGLDHYAFLNLMGAGSIDKSLTPSVIADLDHTDPTSSIRRKMVHIT
jgi:hypothetical protein